MTDSADAPAQDDPGRRDSSAVQSSGADTPDAPDSAGEEGRSSEPDLDALRAEVEEKYDFDDFGPADMAEMTEAEWEAAFDPETWITGRDLLDRVEKDLQNRIANREVFAVLERRRSPDSVLAYSDEGYVVVYADGSVEGEGTVMRDVKPTVALCSMESYEVSEPPDQYELPNPEDVESGTGELGNRMLQAVAGVQIVAGFALGAAWLLSFLPGDLLAGIPLLSAFSLTTLVAPVMGVLFILAGVFMFMLVANARLSDRFRAEEYRDRLRAAGISDDDGPAFATFEDVVDDSVAAARQRQVESDTSTDSDGERSSQ